MKTAFCGDQKGTTWRLPSYVDWILDDVQKLSPLKERWTDTRYFFVLVAAYPSPPAEDWEKLLDKIATNEPASVVELSHLDELGAGQASIGWSGIG